MVREITQEALMICISGFIILLGVVVVAAYMMSD